MSTASAAFKTISRSTTGLPPFILATGGTEYLSGGYKYHEFTSSGTFTVKSVPSYLSTTNGPGSAFNCIDIMLIGGGGGAATTAGGGAGGYVFIRSIRIVPGNYEVVVGSAGLGTGGGGPTKGGDTAFGRGVMTTPLTALGGGAPGTPTKNGGSGAGTTTFANNGIGQQPSSTTGGLGNDGGNNPIGFYGTGGGGAGSAAPSTGGAAGDGVQGDLPDSGGSRGAVYLTNYRWYCKGGATSGVETSNAPSNSGWGGGGGGGTGYNGGSGRIILRYPCAFIYNQ
jgi:hypothetical protein